jgi:C4-dicarboxylate-specific signal transduction histidine kinase
VIVTVTVGSYEQQELSEENLESRRLLADLNTRITASEKALAELESDSRDSISNLQALSSLALLVSKKSSSTDGTLRLEFQPQKRA